LSEADDVQRYVAADGNHPERAIVLMKNDEKTRAAANQPAITISIATSLQ
jgi:hypothetical protein